MNKTKKPMYKISVGSLYYAMNEPTITGDFNPEGYSEVIESPIIKSVNASEETENTPIYSSGKIYDSRSSTSGTDLAVEVIAFDAEDLYKLRGEEIEENGLIFGGGTSIRPYVAIGYPVVKNGNTVRMIWYPQCKLIENTDEIATQEESFAEQNDTLTFTAMPFNEKGQNKVEIDTSTELGKAATEEDFFKKVILKPADYVVGA